MQNFFAKSFAIALLVGGFIFTGDLGWIADKGRRIVGAADVPEGFEVVADTPFQAHAAGSEKSAARSTSSGDSQPDREPSGHLDPVEASFRPPAGSRSEVPWSSLGTGSRVTLWLAGPPYRCLVLDFVDPVSGEALCYDVATVDHTGKPLATAGPPRRVIVGRDDAGRPRGEAILRGGLVEIRQVGINSRAAGQWLGPIAALTVEN